MLFSRPDTFFAKMKFIIGLMIWLATSVMLMIPGNEVNIDNVKIEVVNQITTESTQVELEVTNNTAFAIGRDVFISKFEQNINGEWVEITFDRWINSSDALFRIFQHSILPGETWHGIVSVTGLFDGKEETPPAGNYRLTIGYGTGSSETKYVGYSSCEFTVEQA